MSVGWAELRKPAEDVQIPTGKSRESLYVEGAGLGVGAQRTEWAESRKTKAGKRDLHPSRHVVSEVTANQDKNCIIFSYSAMTGASNGVKLNKSVFRISVRLNHTERDKRREPSTAAGF